VRDYGREFAARRKAAGLEAITLGVLTASSARSPHGRDVLRTPPCLEAVIYTLSLLILTKERW
jgi:hypothetical protein